MSSTHKKVVVLRHDRDTVHGFATPGAFIVGGNFELLNTAGKVVQIGLDDIKAVYFVRDFAEGDILSRKVFASRPRSEGLWVKIKLTDGEVMEALMPNDLTQVAPEGVTVNPPDARGNTQRIFIPRQSIAEATVLAVVGLKPRTKRPAEDESLSLFQ